MAVPYDDTTTAAVPRLDASQTRDRSSACLVVIDGAERGTTHVLHRGRTTLGRELDNTVVLNESALSRHHCEIHVGDGTAWIVDLGSTNGTFVNGEPLSPAATIALDSGDVVEAGTYHLRFLWNGEPEAAYHRSMSELAHRDSLTGLSNRAYLMRHLEQAVIRSRSELRPLSLVMVDIDHFKSVNDAHGHLAGDEILRDIGGLLASRVRRGDCAARFGGEELCLVLHDAGREDVHAVAEELRREIEARVFRADGCEMRITASFGVAELTPQMGTVAELLRTADLCLYAAKSSGRNRTVS